MIYDHGRGWIERGSYGHTHRKSTKISLIQSAQQYKREFNWLNFPY